MLIDEAFITVIAGKGGPGKVSFFPGFKTSPSGGDGGEGGNVYVLANAQYASLERYTSQTKFHAENGGGGDNFRRKGINGKDLILEMPVGTLLKDAQTGEEIELTEAGQKVLLCKGGKGGKGNDFFKSSTNTTPLVAQPGLYGLTRQFKLVMRLIADVGFMGLPNAGKSTLLNMLTAAQVKTANYPFTTLTPNLGALEGVILADIPGLIEGAATGKGLGTRFLKHVEKVSMLVHCISAETEDILKDYNVVRNELKEFNPALLEKPEMVLITKTDLADPKEVKKMITKIKRRNKNVYSYSAYDEKSLLEIKKIILESVKKDTK